MQRGHRLVAFSHFQRLSFDVNDYKQMLCALASALQCIGSVVGTNLMKRLAHLRISIATFAALFAAGAIMPVRAQDADDQQRGVARISLVNGEVSVRRGDSGEWVAAVVNAPLMTEDQ